MAEFVNIEHLQQGLKRDADTIQRFIEQHGLKDPRPPNNPRSEEDDYVVQLQEKILAASSACTSISGLKDAFDKATEAANQQRRVLAAATDELKDFKSRMSDELKQLSQQSNAVQLEKLKQQLQQAQREKSSLEETNSKLQQEIQELRVERMAEKKINQAFSHVKQEIDIIKTLLGAPRTHDAYSEMPKPLTTVLADMRSKLNSMATNAAIETLSNTADALSSDEGIHQLVLQLKDGAAPDSHLKKLQSEVTGLARKSAIDALQTAVEGLADELAGKATSADVAALRKSLRSIPRQVDFGDLISEAVWSEANQNELLGIVQNVVTDPETGLPHMQQWLQTNVVTRLHDLPTLTQIKGTLNQSLSESAAQFAESSVCERILEAIKGIDPTARLNEMFALVKELPATEQTEDFARGVPGLEHFNLRLDEVLRAIEEVKTGNSTGIDTKLQPVIKTVTEIKALADSIPSQEEVESYLQPLGQIKEAVTSISTMMSVSIFEQPGKQHGTETMNTQKTMGGVLLSPGGQQALTAINAAITQVPSDLYPGLDKFQALLALPSRLNALPEALQGIQKILTAIAGTPDMGSETVSSLSDVVTSIRNLRKAIPKSSHLPSKEDITGAIQDLELWDSVKSDLKAATQAAQDPGQLKAAVDQLSDQLNSSLSISGKDLKEAALSLQKQALLPLTPSSFRKVFEDVLRDFHFPAATIDELTDRISLAAIRDPDLKPVLQEALRSAFMSMPLMIQAFDEEGLSNDDDKYMLQRLYQLNHALPTKHAAIRVGNFWASTSDMMTIFGKREHLASLNILLSNTPRRVTFDHSVADFDTGLRAIAPAVERLYRNSSRSSPPTAETMSKFIRDSPEWNDLVQNLLRHPQVRDMTGATDLEAMAAELGNSLSLSDNALALLLYQIGSNLDTSIALGVLSYDSKMQAYRCRVKGPFFSGTAKEIIWIGLENDDSWAMTYRWSGLTCKPSRPRPSSQSLTTSERPSKRMTGGSSLTISSRSSSAFGDPLSTVSIAALETSKSVQARFKNGRPESTTSQLMPPKSIATRASSSTLQLPGSHSENRLQRRQSRTNLLQGSPTLKTHSGKSGGFGSIKGKVKSIGKSFSGGSRTSLYPAATGSSDHLLGSGEIRKADEGGNIWSLPMRHLMADDDYAVGLRRLNAERNRDGLTICLQTQHDGKPAPQWLQKDQICDECRKEGGRQCIVMVDEDTALLKGISEQPQNPPPAIPPPQIPIDVVNAVPAYFGPGEIVDVGKPERGPPAAFQVNDHLYTALTKGGRAMRQRIINGHKRDNKLTRCMASTQTSLAEHRKKTLGIASRWDDTAYACPECHYYDRDCIVMLTQRYGYKKPKREEA